MWRVAPSSCGLVITEFKDIVEEGTMASYCHTRSCKQEIRDSTKDSKRDSIVLSKHSERIEEADVRVCWIASNPFWLYVFERMIKEPTCAEAERAIEVIDARWTQLLFSDQVRLVSVSSKVTMHIRDLTS